MNVSVVIATYRPQGAVVPLRALREQRFKDFDVVLVTEIGAKAWGGEELPSGVQVVEAPPVKYHSPPHVLNLGIDHCTGDIVALLADFAYPDKDWLGVLVETLDRSGACVVGGGKCGHGVANWATCIPDGGAGPCGGKVITPTGDFALGVVLAHPCQAAFNLGNIIFRRVDALAVNGIDERFSGCHGYEDENFVRRMIGHTKQHAVVYGGAVIHHYWPYTSGYKPLLKPEARPWALGVENDQLDRLLTDCEILVGNMRAARVPTIDPPLDVLVERIPSASYAEVP